MENSCPGHLRTERTMGAIPICQIPFTATLQTSENFFADVYLKSNLLLHFAALKDTNLLQRH